MRLGVEGEGGWLGRTLQGEDTDRRHKMKSPRAGVRGVGGVKRG